MPYPAGLPRIAARQGYPENNRLEASFLRHLQQLLITVQYREGVMQSTVQLITQLGKQHR